MVITLTGVSAAGKTFVMRMLIALFGAVQIVTTTTRPRRPGEERTYKYIGLEEFRRRQHEFLWYDEHGGHFYGVTYADIMDVVQSGSIAVMNVMPHRHATLRDVLPEDVVCIPIHLSNPGADEQLKRLLGDGYGEERALARIARDRKTDQDAQAKDLLPESNILPVGSKADTLLRILFLMDENRPLLTK